MKQVNCMGCNNTVEVEETYVEEFCCSGIFEGCGCMGYPINPVFCETCEKKLYSSGESSETEV